MEAVHDEDCRSAMGPQTVALRIFFSLHKVEAWLNIPFTANSYFNKQLRNDWKQAINHSMTYTLALCRVTTALA